MNTKLILVRHGDTEYSKNKLYCGFTDEGLCPEGYAQAESLKAKLADEHIDSVYSSDLKRAFTTAGIIFPDMDIIKEASLRELNFGLWEGLSYKDIMSKNGHLYSNWWEDFINLPTPQGESLSDLNLRVMKTLMNMVKIHSGETIAIIGHGGPFAVIICSLFKKPLENFWDLVPPIASVTEIVSVNKSYDIKRRE